MSRDTADAERAITGSEVLDESCHAWACACEAWVDYLTRLTQAASPLAVFEAGAQLLDDSLSLGDRLAATRLRAAGVSAPLLNDA
ncbi:hypothetical protein [Caulobacter sp. 1776]|uniref:hypothetical protein n=1 Tax=Caulobacter sp. 1776 TaxID=3156420 RepID=UPI00339ADBF0